MLCRIQYLSLEIKLIDIILLKHFPGKKVGLKAAGDIRSTLVALRHQAMMNEILGTEWLKLSLFRIGANSLLEILSNN